jgi:hypothetical protein
MQFRPLIITLLVFAAPSLNAGNIFKCKVADGSTTYSQTPCNNNPDTISVEEAQPPNQSVYGQSQQQIYTTRQNSNQRRITNTRSEEPIYIDIPPEPEKPTPPSTKFVPTTDGDMLLRTGRNSYIDPQTSQPVQAHSIGQDPYDTYDSSMGEYRDKKQTRDVAMEAEKNMAISQNRRASATLCAEYEIELRKLKANHNARPGSRSSLETRNYYYEIRKRGREREKELKRLNSRLCR